MKIVHIIPSLHQGGAENQLEQLILESKKSSYDEHIIIVFMGDKTERWIRLDRKKIEIICVDFDTLFKVKNVFKIRRLIKKISPDIIHSWMYHSNLISFFSTIGFNIPILWGIRRSDIPSRITFLISKLGALFSYSKKIHIVANSHSGFELHKKHGYNCKRFSVIDNGFYFSKMKEDILFPFDINSECSNFISVGRASKDKGHEYLIEAISLLKSENNKSEYKNMRFYIIGRGIPERLTKLIKEKNVNDIVRLFDGIDEISSLMQKFDFFILSSLTEGFPNVLVEAMNAKLLCISSDVGDVKKILPDYQYIYTPKNIIELKDNIRKVALMNNDERKIISDKLFLLSQKYTSYKMFVKYSKIYKKISG